MMEKDDVLEKFLNFYPEEQRENVKQFLGDMTPEMYKLLVEITANNEIDKEKLSQIYMQAPREQRMANGQGIFSLFAVGNNEKSNKLIESVKELTDEKKKFDVFMTMAALIRMGKVSLEDIDLAFCTNENGILLTAKLLSKEVLVATAHSKTDVFSPLGHWTVALISSSEFGSFGEAGTYREAGEKIRAIKEKRKEDHRPAIEGNHDFTCVDIGEFVRNVVNNWERRRTGRDH